MTVKFMFVVAPITIRYLTWNTIFNIIKYPVSAYYTMSPNISLG